MIHLVLKRAPYIKHSISGRVEVLYAQATCLISVPQHVEYYKSVGIRLSPHDTNALAMFLTNAHKIDDRHEAATFIRFALRTDETGCDQYYVYWWTTVEVTHD